ncbi:hypothetical protein OFC58_33505, partial [Escherichia coli]|nr:hypothetical protein [Escherichia coli]
VDIMSIAMFEVLMAKGIKSKVDGIISSIHPLLLKTLVVNDLISGGVVDIGACSWQISNSESES